MKSCLKLSRIFSRLFSRNCKSDIEKLKQFQTDVSHEFKTPLMMMQSRLDVLQKKFQKGLLTPTDQEEFFRIASKSITKMNRLIETLFFLSRCEDPQGHCLQKERVNMQEFLEEKKSEILQMFPEKNISLDLEVTKNLQYHIDPVSVSILLDNLIENAIKFGGENIEIHISASEKCFSLTDRGPGIPQRKQKDIFEKFYRQDTSVEGFGVGLSLVQRIADMYGWKLTLKSEEGKGASFIFSF